MKFTAPLCAFFLALLFNVGTGEASECRVREIIFQESDFSFGDYQVHMGQPEDQQPPRFWLGPASIAGPHGRCQVDENVSILIRPMFVDSKGGLWLSTFSGSESRLVAINPATCAVTWDSGWVGWPARVKNGRVWLDDKPLPLKENCLPFTPSRPDKPGGG